MNVRKLCNRRLACIETLGGGEDEAVLNRRVGIVMGSVSPEMSVAQRGRLERGRLENDVKLSSYSAVYTVQHPTS